jgi:hypothetical protein
VASARRSGESGGALEFTTAGTVGADEVGVAERTAGPRTVDLARIPQVAAGEPAEHSWAPGVHALALKRVEDLL